MLQFRNAIDIPIASQLTLEDVDVVAVKVLEVLVLLELVEVVRVADVVLKVVDEVSVVVVELLMLVVLVDDVVEEVLVDEPKKLCALPELKHKGRPCDARSLLLELLLVDEVLVVLEDEVVEVEPSSEPYLYQYWAVYFAAPDWLETRAALFLL